MRRPDPRVSGDGKRLRVEHDGQRLEVTRDRDERVRLFLSVRDPAEREGWRRVSHVPSALLEGPSFDLRLRRWTIARAAAGRVEVRLAGWAPGRDLARAKREHTWTARLTAARGDAWFWIDLAVRLPAGLRLRRRGLGEPAIVIWLDRYETLSETQWHDWRRTIVGAPTTNCQGTPGNDLPAGYRYEPDRRAELLLYVDMSRTDWMSNDNMCRFRDYRIGRVLDQASRRDGFGLAARSSSGDRVAPGTLRMRYALRVADRPEQPTAWEALETLIGCLMPALEPAASPPLRWDRMARGTLDDLRRDAACWHQIRGVGGHPAYARDRARERQHDSLELMTQLDVAWPLAAWSVLGAEDEAAASAGEHLARLRPMLDLFHRPEIDFVSNSWPRPDTDGSAEVVDSWYPFWNALVKLPCLARVSADAKLRAMADDALRGATRLAHRCGYNFPLFYDAERLQAVGSATNFGVAGFYACGHLLAAPEGEHVAEAARALRAMHAQRLEQLYHEPHQLSFAALAAAELAARRPEEAAEWRGVARDFVNAQLRLNYWTADPYARSLGVDNRGMTQACASILYPAFKENVETVLPYPALAAALPELAPRLLPWVDLQRCHDRFFFDEHLPPDLRSGDGSGGHIPYENLSLLEQTGTFGALGKELYGAGEVVWLYLLTEARAIGVDRAGRVDPSALVLDLDAVTLAPTSRWPDGPRRFVVYHPGANATRVKLRLHADEVVRVGGALTLAEAGRRARDARLTRQHIVDVPLADGIGWLVAEADRRRAAEAAPQPGGRPRSGPAWSRSEKRDDPRSLPSALRGMRD
jgi:hypothetical protein